MIQTQFSRLQRACNSTHSSSHRLGPAPLHSCCCPWWLSQVMNFHSEFSCCNWPVFSPKDSHRLSSGTLPQLHGTKPQFYLWLIQSWVFCFNWGFTFTIGLYWPLIKSSLSYSPWLLDASKPVSQGRHLHFTEFRYYHKVQTALASLGPQLPVLSLRKFSQIYDPGWCWSLLNHHLISPPSNQHQLS